jgi:hypothetical protein
MESEIMIMQSAVMEAYDSGILSREDHSRLVQNLEHYAQKANILDLMILNKMSFFACTEAEIDYTKAIKRMAAKGNYGLIYTGKETSPVITRMMAVAGACLRNFVDAKVVTLQELLSDIKEGNHPEARVLLIPNFFINRADGGKIAEWHIPELLHLLYSRMMKGQQTFLYVSDFDALRKNYGDPIANHLEKSFRSIPA